MRFVIYGAGSVGGAIAVRLAERGADVVLIARGARAAVLRDRGVTLVKDDGTATARPRVVEHPRELTWTGDEVVILAVMSQDTPAALEALAPWAPPSIDLVCAQNGIANERMALRRFPNVTAMYVWMPAEHVEPGLVRVYTTPRDGVLDVGRYPRGVDARIEAIARAFEGTPFEAEARADIMAWKNLKLLWNLHNAVDAACGEIASESARELIRRSYAEGEATFAAAGLEILPLEVETARRADRFPIGKIAGMSRPGGSTRQSLARGTGALEVDYLNGEVVLLGRLHGVPTPVNELLQRTANELARDRRPPGAVNADELLRRLG
jgi:2-dehydropantoate 2-reductase